MAGRPACGAELYRFRDVAANASWMPPLYHATDVPPSTLDEIFFSRSRLTWDAWVRMWDAGSEDAPAQVSRPRSAQVSRPRRNRRPQVSRILEGPLVPRRRCFWKRWPLRTGPLPRILARTEDGGNAVCSPPASSR